MIQRKGGGGTVIVKNTARYCKSLEEGEEEEAAADTETWGSFLAARGRQECTNLAIIPEGRRGLLKWPLKNEDWPS